MSKSEDVISEAQRLHDSGRDPCQKHACHLQDCLQKNNYQESKCEHVINDILKCCSRQRDRSIVCSGFLKKLAFMDMDKN